MSTPLPPPRIFCGYAHADQALFEQLKTALAVLIRQEAMSIWHDGDLLPGDQWEYEIERELNAADIILLLRPESDHLCVHFEGGLGKLSGRCDGSYRARTLWECACSRC